MQIAESDQGILARGLHIPSVGWRRSSEHSKRDMGPHKRRDRFLRHEAVEFREGCPSLESGRNLRILVLGQLLNQRRDEQPRIPGAPAGHSQQALALVLVQLLYDLAVRRRERVIKLAGVRCPGLRILHRVHRA